MEEALHDVVLRHCTYLALKRRDFYHRLACWLGIEVDSYPEEELQFLCACRRQLPTSANPRGTTFINLYP